MFLFRSHDGRVTGLSVSPCGQWLASISPVDGCLRIWETLTNFCFRCYQLTPPVRDPTRKEAVAGGLLKEKGDGEDDDEERLPCAYVAWNPNPELCLVAAAM